jgi:hypothetical protein
MVLECCWRTNPTERPHMSLVIEMLNAMPAPRQGNRHFPFELPLAANDPARE